MGSRTTQLALMLIALLAAGRSSAIDAYWAAISVKPETIVIGSVVQIEAPAFEVDSGLVQDGSHVVQIFATGQVRADSALWGVLPEEPIPLCWEIGSRLEPSVPGKSVWLSSSETFSEGERRIWVVWPLGEVRKRGVDCDHFQALDINQLDKVNADIGKYLKD